MNNYEYGMYKQNKWPGITMMDQMDTSLMSPTQFKKGAKYISPGEAGLPSYRLSGPGKGVLAKSSIPEVPKAPAFGPTGGVMKDTRPDRKLAIMEIGGGNNLVSGIQQGAKVLDAVSNISTSGGQQSSPYGGYSPSGRPMNPHPAYKAQSSGNLLSSIGDAGLTAAPMTGPAAPYVAIASGVAKVAGEGIKLYSAFQEAEQAEKEYKELMKEWKKQKRREEEDRRRELKRQKMQDAYAGSSQAAALEDRFASAYGGYRQGGQ